MVFRKCRSPSAKQAAGRLLAENSAWQEKPGLDGTELFGLWDLTARAGEDLAGAAATRPLGNGGTVRLTGIAVKTGLRRLGLARRLISEVADVLRAQGAARLIAGPTGGDDPASALLRSTGFVPAGAWWELKF